MREGRPNIGLLGGIMGFDESERDARRSGSLAVRVWGAGDGRGESSGVGCADAARCWWLEVSIRRIGGDFCTRSATNEVAQI